MEKKYIIQILLCALAVFLPACVSANSLEEYRFDDTFFSGSYAPQYYESADVYFSQVGNNFGGKIFFQDLKVVELTQLEILGYAQRYCMKQVRGFYLNSARGSRVRPLDQESLAYLQSVDPSYNDLTMTGGFFVCSNPSNGVVGYIQHTWKGEPYSLVAGLEYDFVHNTYLPSYDPLGNFLFESGITTGYLRDSYGGIAQLIGSGLDVQYVCGNAILEDGETCDAGGTNGQILGGCNATCNGYVANICGNATIEYPETCDEGSGLNGQPGHCNLACSGTINLPPSGGGGGGGGSLGTDAQQGICEVRDCSDSYYDGICGTCTAKDIEKYRGTGSMSLLINTPEAFTDEVERIQGVVGGSYSLELIQGYVFAKDVGITTMSDIDKANMGGSLLRSHMAKMLVNYAVKVLYKTPDPRKNCSFSDMANVSVEMQGYSRLACQLGLMGLKKDGTPDTKFNPNGEVTRAQFGAVLSRLLYGDTYNGQAGQYYTAHLQALNDAGIMTKISQPQMLEQRGWVMVMLKRVAEK